MEELECNVIINQNNNEMKITGLKTNLVLDYANDIDFTDLISELVELIDKNNIVNFHCPETKDEKEQLILETLRDIFEEYNKCLQSEDTTEEI